MYISVENLQFFFIIYYNAICFNFELDFSNGYFKVIELEDLHLTDGCDSIQAKLKISTPSPAESKNLKSVKRRLQFLIIFNTLSFTIDICIFTIESSVKNE